MTVMEIRGDEFLALATDGDVQLGGQDFDQRLVDYLAEEFIRKHKLDPREDPNTAGRMWREGEDAKRTLSARMKASLSCDYKGQAVRMEVPREKFEEITHGLARPHAVYHPSNAAGRGLELEGHGRRVARWRVDAHAHGRPHARDASGKEPDNSVAVDEAVAHGACAACRRSVGTATG